MVCREKGTVFLVFFSLNTRVCLKNLMHPQNWSFCLVKIEVTFSPCSAFFLLLNLVIVEIFS